MQHFSHSLQPLRETSLQPPPQVSVQLPPQTSVLAIIALIFAAISPVMICLCYASIPISTIALILGHVSLYSISRESHRLSGRGLAITSLAVAYPVLVLSVVLLSYWIANISKGLDELRSSASEQLAQQQETTQSKGGSQAETRLRQAEQSIMALQGDAPGRGNNAKAVELAESFAERMLMVRETAFTSGKKSLFQLSKGQFITYVELHENSALFLVHVPDYRKFDREAKEELGKLAWLVAQLTVEDELPEDADLAVALKGTLLYGDIMVGYVSKVEALQDNYLIRKKEDLLPFFPEEVPSVLAHEPPLIEDPQEIESQELAVSPGEIAAASEPMKAVVANIEKLDSPLPTIPPPSAELDSFDIDSTAKDVVQTPIVSQPIPTDAFEQKLQLVLDGSVPKTSWGLHSMAWSHHGKWFAIGKIDDTLRLVDSVTGKTLSEIKNLSDLRYINALDFSADDSRLIAATYSGQTAVFWVDQQGQLKYEGDLQQQIAGEHLIVCSPRYPFAMSAGRDGMLVWQSLEPPKQAKQLRPFTRRPLAIWLPSEGVQARAVCGESLVQFSLRDATLTQQHPIKRISATGACFSADGNQCVMIESDDVYWIDCNAPAEPSKIYAGERDRFTAVCFHPNQRWIAVAGRKNVLICDVVDRQPMVKVSLDSASRIECLQFSPDGKRLAVSQASEDSDIHFYEISNM